MTQMTSLAIILASFWTIGGATLTVQGKMYANLDLSDVAFTENLLFESPSVSSGHCALLCNRQCACVTFTFHDNHCKGHDIQVNSSTSSVTALGARTFGRKRNLDWLSTVCTTNSDCMDASNAECFKGKCLCTPVYFYSVGSRTCVPTCNDLQFTYTMYPGSYIRGNNEYWNSAGPDCQSFCDADHKCLNWECNASGHSCQNDCYFHYVTALDVPGAWVPHDDGANIYQRNCA